MFALPEHQPGKHASAAASNVTNDNRSGSSSSVTASLSCHDKQMLAPDSRPTSRRQAVIVEVDSARLASTCQLTELHDQRWVELHQVARIESDPAFMRRATVSQATIGFHP